MIEQTCRFCHIPLQHTVIDLGTSPLANAYLTATQLTEMEPHYPLHTQVCGHCFLVQLPAVATPENIFGDYAYFSSYAASWVEHARQYATQITARLALSTNSQVIEIASNDGYLLQHFQAQNIPVLGIEPAQNVAAVAQQQGIQTQVAFFSEALAKTLTTPADLLIGNNVFAHVPDINDFAAGFRHALKPHGVLTLEFPHVLNLLAQNQFDTIYHEHFSYLSLHSTQQILAAHGMQIFDVEELPTHGGSLRIYAQRQDGGVQPLNPRVAALQRKEAKFGITELNTYQHFGAKVAQVKRELLQFLLNAHASGRRVAAYGAPAKGNTLLNYCGIGPELLPYTVDASPHKQGRFLPGSRIPIFSSDKILQEQPDDILILPWNLAPEICTSMAAVRDWGGRFIVPIPELTVLA